MFYNWYRIWWTRNQLWDCTHFRHPTDEQPHIRSWSVLYELYILVIFQTSISPEPMQIFVHGKRHLKSFIEIYTIKGPLKYLLMPLLGKNQFAITLHMCASTGPNLDNSHRELKWISSLRHRTTPKVTWPETKKCILTKWLNPFFRIFCTITIQKPFWINLSMKKWEEKMSFFDHSFAHIFLLFIFSQNPCLNS